MGNAMTETLQPISMGSGLGLVSRRETLCASVGPGGEYGEGLGSDLVVSLCEMVFRCVRRLGVRRGAGNSQSILPLFHMATGVVVETIA